MATVRQCRAALDQLASLLASVDPELRRRHVPARSVMCTVKDLDLVYTARLGKDGVHDLRRATAGSTPNAEVKVVVDSDDLVALAAGHDDVMTAWLHGRVQVSAPMRDMLRMRSLFGL